MTSQPPLIEEPSVLLTVWDDAWAAITKPRYYVKWAVLPFKRALAYACILFTVMALVTSIYAVLTVRGEWLAARPWIETNIPTLTMTDNQLSIEGDKTFSYSDNSEIFIRVDTTDQLKDVAIDPFYQFGIVVTSDGVLVRSEGKTTAKLFSDSPVDNFTTNGAEIAAGANRLLITLAILLPFFMFAWFFIGNMMYTGVFAFLMSLVNGFRPPMRVIWTMALYALTPSLLVSYLLFIVYPLPLVSNLVFFVYLVLATLHYRRFMDIKARVS